MQHSRITGGNKGYRNNGPSGPERDARRVGVRHRLLHRHDLSRGERAAGQGPAGRAAARAVCTAISTGYPASPEARRLSSAPAEVRAAVPMGRAPIEGLIR